MRISSNCAEVAGYGIEAPEIVPAIIRRREPSGPESQLIPLACTIEEKPDLPVSHYDGMLSLDLDAETRQKVLRDREEAKRFHADYVNLAGVTMREQSNIPASKIFVALRDGSLTAKGRRL